MGPAAYGLKHAQAFLVRRECGSMHISAFGSAAGSAGMRRSNSEFSHNPASESGNGGNGSSVRRYVSFPHHPSCPFPEGSLLSIVLRFSTGINRLGDHCNLNTGLQCSHICMVLRRLLESQTPFVPLLFFFYHKIDSSRSG